MLEQDIFYKDALRRHAVRVRVRCDRGCEGAPDMVVEVVSPSNPEMDYVSKLNLYREAGVREYWICDPQRERTLAYSFGSEAIMALYALEESVPSSTFPGLSIDFSAIVAGM